MPVEDLGELLVKKGKYDVYIQGEKGRYSLVLQMKSVDDSSSQQDTLSIDNIAFSMKKYGFLYIHYTDLENSQGYIPQYISKTGGDPVFLPQEGKVAINSDQTLVLTYNGYNEYPDVQLTHVNLENLSSMIAELDEKEEWTKVEKKRKHWMDVISGKKGLPVLACQLSNGYLPEEIKAYFKEQHRLN